MVYRHLYLHAIFMAMVFLCSFLIFSRGDAAGRVYAEDFSYQGITLGDTKQKLYEKWGEPSFDKIRSVWGIQVQFCTYEDVVVGISAASGKVVDISLTGDRYRLRKNIRYGATSSYIFRTFGKTAARLLDDDTCYVYDHPEYKHLHLVVAVDPEKKALRSVRMTMLPLTDEEADEMALEHDDTFTELDLSSAFIAAKEIDISALPKQEPVRLGGYH